jgi:Leucine-rich repeat (LRR) protein
VGTIANVNAATTTITMNGPYSIKANFEQEEGVTFLDANLEAAIREAVAKPTGPIYPSDLEGLTSFASGNWIVSDLTGLEYCTNLHELYLCCVSQVSDISPLANLTSLTVLHLGYNRINDISPLANLSNLTWLDLAHNQIGDIYPLASLNKLTDLNLAHNQISDVSPLVNLTNLMGLKLDENQISDISPLASLTNMVVLHLQANQISDISPLVQNEGLLGTGDFVILFGNPLSDDSTNLYIPQLQARGVNVEY